MLIIIFSRVKNFIDNFYYRENHLRTLKNLRTPPKKLIAMCIVTKKARKQQQHFAQKMHNRLLTKSINC